MSDLATVLAEIKQNFYTVVELVQQEETLVSAQLKAAMELLADSLHQFPFSFNDLTKICDLIFMATN